MLSQLPASEKLAAILRISQRMNSERDLHQLLDLVAEEGARLLGAERASIFLLSEDGRELTSKVALGSSEMIRLDSKQGIAGTVVSTCEEICVDDAYGDTRFYQGVDERSGYRTKNMLAVPLTDLDGRAIGAFEILNKREGIFDEEDKQITRALAASAAIAIQTAKFILELQRHRVRLEDENRNLLRELGGKLPGKTILGSHPKIEELRRMIERVADAEVTVLITGESGTGKDLIARSLHFASPRAARPFVALNCAALPETLVETELFGVEKGVATGVDRRAGKFESAHGGTLFLDEIGDLSLAAQAKILRVLQERVVERIGGRTPIPVDVRVIAATNKDLVEAIQKNLFREDLFYRLNVIHLRTTPLRQMTADIPALAAMLLLRIAEEMRRPALTLSDAALKALAGYRWPGNIRQLENELRRAMVVARGKMIEPEDFSEALQGAPEKEGVAEAAAGRGLQDEIEDLERRRIQEAMARHGQNQQKTARALGLSRQGLINKLKRYGIKANAAEDE